MKRSSLRFTASAVFCAAFLAFSPQPAHAQRILNTILDAARDAREAAQDARNTSRDMRDNMRNGVASVTGDLRADGNGNELIDDGDYAIWKSHFGETYSFGGGAVTSVPESAGLLIFALGAAIGFRRQRRLS